MQKFFLLFLAVFICGITAAQKNDILKRQGIKIGILPQGKQNAITDVPGVKVGQVTLIKADSIRTGVTAILPHGGNVFQQKVPAAIFLGNGFGKLAGYSQVKELGNIETPIVLTNTLNVAAAMDAVITYTLQQKGNEKIQSVNAVVGETNDGYLNDIAGRHVTAKDVLKAIETATADSVAQGNVGAGTGTVCFGFKGGIGTASRKTPKSRGGYTVGVLVQTNFGGVLEIAGVPVGQKLNKFYLKDELNNTVDGSCMIVVATDAPLDARNLERLAKRAFMGLAKTGGIASNGSGDYIIAFSTDSSVRVPYDAGRVLQQNVLSNDEMTPLFLAAIEATEEAIINSLFAAETMKGKNNRTVEALPVKEVIEIFKNYKALR